MASDWERFAALSTDAFDEEIHQVACDMSELLAAKRKSYGPNNLTKFGDVGVLVRASDKFERLVHMHRNGLTTTAVGEDDEDAWADICGYSMLVLLARRLGKNRTVDHAGPLPEAEPERIVRG